MTLGHAVLLLPPSSTATMASSFSRVEILHPDSKDFRWRKACRFYCWRRVGRQFPRIARTPGSMSFPWSMSPIHLHSQKVIVTGMKLNLVHTPMCIDGVTGRANVGKSSLFNAVLGRKSLLHTSKRAVSFFFRIYWVGLLTMQPSRAIHANWTFTVLALLLGSSFSSTPQVTVHGEDLSGVRCLINIYKPVKSR